jgi:hypothetical protein
VALTEVSVVGSKPNPTGSTARESVRTTESDHVQRKATPPTRTDALRAQLSGAVKLDFNRKSSGRIESVS